MTGRRSADEGFLSRSVTDAILRHAGLGDTLRSIAAELPPRRGRPWLQMADAIDRGDGAAAMTVSRTVPAIWLPLVSCHAGDPRLLPRLLRTAERTRSPAEGWWSPLAYPLLAAAATLGLLGTMAATVVPLFREIFSDFGMRLPAVTLWVLGLGEFMASGWKPLALATGTAALAWVATVRLSPRRAAGAAAFTRGLGWLVGGGLPADDAILAAAHAVGATPPERGRPAWPLTHAAMAALDCEPAAAATVLEAVAACHDDRARRHRGLSRALSVVVTVVVAAGVAFLAIALLTPLVTLVSNLS